MSLMHPIAVSIPAITRKIVAQRSPDCLKPIVNVKIPAAMKPNSKLWDLIKSFYLSIRRYTPCS